MTAYNFYETTFILRQDTSMHDVKAITKEFTAILQTMGARIVKHEYWGFRQLAYMIKKNKRGHYVMLGIQASHAAVKELERNYKIKESVIRFLTIRVDKIDQEPSFIMQAKAEENRKHFERISSKGSHGDVAATHGMVEGSATDDSQSTRAQ